MNTTPPQNTVPDPAELMPSEAFDELDDILDDLRTRYDETPQWEFCEGAIAALICCRRPILPSEYLPVLLGIGPNDPMGAPIDPPDPDAASFADPVQAARFMTLWIQRWNEIAEALNSEVETLDDERCYQPELMDIRGAVAAMPQQERDALGDEPIPAFGQVWALGFMFVVENWPEEWTSPREKEAAEWFEASMEAIVIMTEDDEGKATISPLGDDGPPSVSLGRLNHLGDAIWAVYDLREIWRNIGPRVEQVFRADTPGRNDPCFCGSGKKYKKCHGA
jgi:uncharacterized protein